MLERIKPNHLTYGALACVVVSIALTLFGLHGTALLVFMIAQGLCVADGAWSRDTGKMTDFGRDVLSPLAGAGLTLAWMVAFSVAVPWWHTALIVTFVAVVTGVLQWTHVRWTSNPNNPTLASRKRIQNWFHPLFNVVLVVGFTLELLYLQQGMRGELLRAFYLIGLGASIVVSLPHLHSLFTMPEPPTSKPPA